MDDGEWCYNTSNEDGGLIKSSLSPFTFLPLPFSLNLSAFMLFLARNSVYCSTAPLTPCSCSLMLQNPLEKQIFNVSITVLIFHAYQAYCTILLASSICLSCLLLLVLNCKCLKAVGVLLCCSHQGPKELWVVPYDWAPKVQRYHMEDLLWPIWKITYCWAEDQELLVNSHQFKHWTKHSMVWNILLASSNQVFLCSKQATLKTP